MKTKAVKPVNVSKKKLKRVAKISNRMDEHISTLQEAVKDIRKATTELQDAMRRLDDLAPLKQEAKVVAA